MTHTSFLPLHVRIINRFGSGLGALGLPLIRLEPHALKVHARRETGLFDFGSSEFEEGLDILCRSANNDAGLSLIGRIGFRNIVTEALKSRLRRIDEVKHRPEIFEKSLNPPIIILGARSGTTFLHRLLCQDQGARPLTLWEVMNPGSTKDANQRRKEAIQRVAAQKRLYANIDAKHYIDADQPEEDIFLLNSSLKSPAFYMMAPVFSYAEWIRKQDMESAYLEYLQHLQIFQAATPDKRLTLKAPAHLGNIKAFLHAIPNALIVQTHREPVEVLASLNSLISTMHAGVCDSFEQRRMAKFTVEAFEDMLKRGEEVLDSLPSEQQIHLRYKDLVADPVGTVQRLYEHFGLDFTDEFEKKLEDFVVNRPKNKFGRHEYNIEDFGFTEEDISKRFAHYRERFLKAEN